MNDPAELATLNLRPGIMVTVGVSGGPDSLALLHFLHSLHYPLLVATFDHLLRPESAADVEFVCGFARQLGLPFVTGQADVAAHAASNGLSIEEAARELRYRFLFRAARDAGAQAVVVGHTADDQAETVLMHFLRGAGLSGLKGMPPRTILPVFDSNIPLVRPLLSWTRAETEAYCRLHVIEPRLDSSNTDTRFYRNRLRHELLPILESFNPQVRQTLARTALALQGDHDLLENLLESSWQESVRSADANYVEFDRTVLAKFPPALLRGLFRRAAFQLKPGLRDVDFDALQRAASLKPVDLAGGLTTLLEQDSLYLVIDRSLLPSHAWPQISQPFPLAEGSVDLGNGWTLTCQDIPTSRFPPDMTANSDRFTAWLDADLAAGNLYLRPPKSGDRFEPLGMPKQTIKLSDLFINLKIPKRVRPHWPLVFDGDVLVWVPGLRLPETRKLTGKTTRAVRITFTRKTGQA